MSTIPEKATLVPTPTLFQSLIPILALIILLVFNVLLFGDNATGGANQVALLLAGAIAGLVAWYLKMSWTQVMKGVLESINSAMSAVLILLMIGALAGTWMLSGIVPALIYYGLQVLTPTFFLVASCIVCALVSLGTGSSWSTIATVGIALLGIGAALGFDEGLVAGAIISGAYFGDKMSPLSDTTNLAPAMAGTDLFTHIRYMLFTTVPSFTITLILFLIIGLNSENTASSSNVNEIMNAIEGTFSISPFLFVVPVAVIVLIVRKVPALPSLLIGSVLGGIFAIIFQPEIIDQVANVAPTLEGLSKEPETMYRNMRIFALENFGGYTAVMMAMFGDVSLVTESETVNGLLSSSGMSGMLGTIWLILCAMIFGGVMDSVGMLARISNAVISLAHSTGSMIAATVGTCIVFNLTASDQYLAVVVPGKMYANAFRKKGLAPENLSRTLEDSGTVTSVLIPWNTCGATQAGVLKVATLDYAPYCFFNIISPFMSIIFGYVGIRIRKVNPETGEPIK
ncbi:Na+/H+ antiporter NhaC [Bernardetia sp. ABR2-2B]|uniref:Na+/H+ antiporter NhaC n=1 Tax=Bernardetia sp. ABR2-2B TaxID=3127472 RepID=UPI0030D20803